MLIGLKRVPDQPEHRRPKAHEERPALGVSALLLIDGLGADPQRDAEIDRGQRGRMQMPAAQAAGAKGFCEPGGRVPTKGAGNSP